MRNKFLTKILGATLGLAMAIGVGVGVANYSNKIVRKVNADGELVFSFDYSDIPDGFTATTGTSGDFTVGSNPNILTVNYSGINTKSSAGADDHAYGYAMFLKNYGYVYSNNTFSGYYVSNVRVVIGANSGQSGKIGCSFNSSAITDRNSSVNGSVTKGETYNYPNAVSTKTYWNFSTTGANVQIDSFQITYSPVPQGTYYTVTFDSKGGSSVNPQSVLDGSTASTPAAPTKAGYVFGGWYTNEELTGDPFNFSTAITADRTLYAKWTKVAATATYSPSTLTDATGYRIVGEVTARTDTNRFYIQDGNNAMQIYDATSAASVEVGNTVDLFGVFDNGNNRKNIANVAYCEKTSTDTTNSQTPLTELSSVTDANLYKYFEISQLQLDSGFVYNSNQQANIKNSSVVVYYRNTSFVNNGSFVPGNFAANDYVVVKGVINKYNSTFELEITSIQKMAQFTVSFESNGGTSVASQTVLDGTRATEPDPAPTKASDENNSYTFAGWYSNPELTGDAYDFNTAVTGTLTLYAKWNATPITAKQVVENKQTKASLTYHYSKNEETSTDTLDKEKTGVSGNSYKNWSNVSDSSNARYAGNSYGDHASAIQFRKSTGTNPKSAIISTTSGGTIKKISVEWAAGNQSGKTLNVYGSNTAYTSLADVYDSATYGTLLGTIVEGTSTELNVVGSYAYVGVVPTTGTAYLTSISFEWNATSFVYSNASIRFSSLISASLWNRLNTESSIQGYGVMLSTPETLGTDPIEDWYGVADGDTYEEKIAYLAAGGVKNFYLPLTTKSPDLANAAQKAGAEGDHYIWYLNKVVLDTEEGLTAQQVKAKLTQRYTAVAYIRIADELVFLDQTTASAAGLADAAITGGQATASTANGSLKNLADMLA